MQHSPKIFEPGVPIGSPPPWMDDRFLTGRAAADWHLENSPNLSLAEYARIKRVEQARAVASKCVIYLDQRYWIHCRDAAIGRAQGVYADIWKSLLRLVRERKAVCPVSSASLIETLKQADAETRVHTAMVMDELSAGVAFRSPSGRRQAEFHFLLGALGESTSAEHPSTQAYSWLVEVFGDLAVADECDAEANAMGKATFDMFCRMRFPDLLKALPSLDTRIFERDRAYRDKHNGIASRVLETSSSYRERLHREMKGIIRGLRKDLMPLFLESTNGSEKLANVIAERLEELLIKKDLKDDLKHEFPSGYVRAAIYATTDHKRRRFEDGDMFDHEHAIAALPYSRLFLTERKLGTLLTETPAHLDKKYGCRVLWKNEDILAVLLSL